MWFKPDDFKHSTYGTVLMTKVNRNDPGSWTRHVWGEMLTAIRPADFAETGSLKNSLSVMFNYPIGGTPNLNHNLGYDGIAKDYELQKDKWYHVCVVKKDNKVALYLNGVKKFEENVQYSATWANANFYVGGNIWNCGYFMGTVDEVQIWNKALSEADVLRSMKGYKIAPKGLQGYFTFEKVGKDDEENSYFPNKGKNSVAVKGGYVTFCNAPKEAVTEEPIQNDIKLVAGVPFMTGSLPIEFKSVKWLTQGGDCTHSDEKSATVTYTKEGKHSVVLELTNTWGTTTKRIDDYIIVGNGDGVNEEEVENLNIYPNPFENEVNLLFVESGNYKIKVYDSQGRVIQIKNCTATTNDALQLTIEGSAGLYYVVVMKGDKYSRSFKLIKK
jgi:PKD repeat protein